MAQFLNERKKASRKEIAEFLSRETGASQSKTDALLGVIANSPKIQALPQEKRIVLKTSRGIYEISKAGEKLLKSKNARQNFEDWIDSVYVETATQKPQDLPVSKKKKYLKTITALVVHEIKDKMIGEAIKKPIEAIKTLALKLMKKHKYLGKFYAFRHVFLALLAAKIAFDVVKFFKNRKLEKLLASS
ncbi:restriction endonuclease [uncultured Campylobacter sp.]|uniref:restriction endonuclease n=1 Tax=uncultured Campylobacter sp. TaxID=218934 RepID=UPI002636079C|nr:restriction endonuclease [uncultured Campylobacter sp.]